MDEFIADVTLYGKYCDLCEEQDLGLQCQTPSRF